MDERDQRPGAGGRARHARTKLDPRYVRSPRRSAQSVPQGQSVDRAAKGDPLLVGGVAQVDRSIAFETKEIDA
jgi:hypothetical protein